MQQKENQSCQNNCNCDAIFVFYDYLKLIIKNHAKVNSMMDFKYSHKLFQTNNLVACPTASTGLLHLLPHRKSGVQVLMLFERRKCNKRIAQYKFQLNFIVLCVLPQCAMVYAGQRFVNSDYPEIVPTIVTPMSRGKAWDEPPLEKQHGMQAGLV